MRLASHRKEKVTRMNYKMVYKKIVVTFVLFTCQQICVFLVTKAESVLRDAAPVSSLTGL